MSNENEAIAKQAVEVFKALLDDNAQEAVGEKNFNYLRSLIGTFRNITGKIRYSYKRIKIRGRSTCNGIVMLSI